MLNQSNGSLHSTNSGNTTRSLLDGISGVDHSSGLGLGGVLVQLHQFGEVELGLLEDLGLSDHAAVLEWEDLGALGLDLLANLFFEAIE